MDEAEGGKEIIDDVMPASDKKRGRGSDDSSSGSDYESPTKRHPRSDFNYTAYREANALEKNECGHILKNDDETCWPQDDDARQHIALDSSDTTSRINQLEITVNKLRNTPPKHEYLSSGLLTLEAAEDAEEAAEALLLKKKKKEEKIRRRKLYPFKMELAHTASLITTNLLEKGEISNDRAQIARKYQAQLENKTGCLRSVLCNDCGCRLLNPDPSFSYGGQYLYCCPGCGDFGKTSIHI